MLGAHSHSDPITTPGHATDGDDDKHPTVKFQQIFLFFVAFIGDIIFLFISSCILIFFSSPIVFLNLFINYLFKCIYWLCFKHIFSLSFEIYLFIQIGVPMQEIKIMKLFDVSIDSLNSYKQLFLISSLGTHLHSSVYVIWKSTYVINDFPFILLCL